MKFLKKPVVAIILCLAVVLSSSAISINVKLNNKCEDIVDGFYHGIEKDGFLITSIYYNLCDLCDLSDEIAPIADNYGIDTRELSYATEHLREQIKYQNEDIDEIFDSYDSFYNSLYHVLVELSNTGLSQRHLEYMTTATEQINNIRITIDKSGYNESVRKFYKKFDKFPVNIFAEIFDVDYPDYFA